MTSATAKLSYQRLKHQPNLFDQQDYIYNNKKINILEKVLFRRSRRLRRVHIRRRLRVKIPSLRRFLRRKTRLVKAAWRKVYKRLKESQSHFGDLFAGNYLFMQVTPTPFKHSDKYNLSSSSSSSTSVKPNHHLHAFPSVARY